MVVRLTISLNSTYNIPASANIEEDPSGAHAAGYAVLFQIPELTFADILYKTGVVLG